MNYLPVSRQRANLLDISRKALMDVKSRPDNDEAAAAVASGGQVDAFAAAVLYLSFI